MTKEEFRSRIGIEITSHWREDVIDGLLDEYTASYAKQQAIAFFKFCLPGPTDFEPHVSKRYDQFIEQQNKP